jgi:hypothetical protein
MMQMASMMLQDMDRLGIHCEIDLSGDCYQRLTFNSQEDLNMALLSGAFEQRIDNKNGYKTHRYVKE